MIITITETAPGILGAVFISFIFFHHGADNAYRLLVSPSLTNQEGNTICVIIHVHVNYLSKKR
jgi:hypothetical protein